MSANSLSNALFTAAQVRRVDARVISRHGVSGLELMRRAAAAAFESLRRRWPLATRALVCCGPGNNGADGFLLAHLARQAGFSVSVVALGDCAAGDAKSARDIWGGPVVAASEDCLTTDRLGADCDVVVDALFGTGLARDLDGIALNLIDSINALTRPVLALDIPSGLCSDTGVVRGRAVRATVTVSFIAWKRGLFSGEALDYCGERELAALDLAPVCFDGEAPDCRLIDWASVRAALPDRPNNSHKGLFGNVLAVGGDLGMGGAIALTAQAALRCGSGVVRVATRAEHVGGLLAARPELMARGYDGPQDLAQVAAGASAIALGPGLGLAAWGHALWHAALDADRPAVLDADGLTLLARHPRALPANTVLTPHPGEAARLLDCSIVVIQRDRYAAVRALAAKYAVVVVLKGAGSLVAVPSGEVEVCAWGNPGMASAGTGDVLCGAIAALLAQGLDAWCAARLGVAAHARAGDAAARARGPRGLLASDLFLPLQCLLNGREPDA